MISNGIPHLNSTSRVIDSCLLSGFDLILTILQEQADRGFQDPRIIKLLFENMEEVRKAVKERQEQARHYYQTEVEKSE